MTKVGFIGRTKSLYASIQLQIIEAKKNERANELKEVKRLCKEFVLPLGYLKGTLAKGCGDK